MRLDLLGAEMVEHIKAMLLKFKGWWSRRSLSKSDPEMDDIVLATSFQEMLDAEDSSRHGS